MISCGIAVPGRKFTLAFFRFEVSQQPGQQATSDPLNSIIGNVHCAVVRAGFSCIGLLSVSHKWKRL